MHARAFLRSYWQLLAGSVLIAGGITAIVIGWIGASGTNQVWVQMPYVISGGLLGLALVFAGAALVFAFYLARMNLVMEHRLRAIEDRLPAPDGRAAVNGRVVVVASSGTRFHRPDCSLVTGKSRTRTLTPEDAEAQGLVACGVCEPANRP